MDYLRSVYIGREQEIRTVVAGLERSGRGAFIIGPRGSGKSTLARITADQLTDVFPGGIAHVRVAPGDTPESLFARHFTPPLIRRSLLVIDEAENLSAASIKQIDFLLRQEERLSILVASTTRLKTARKIPIVELKPLSSQQIADLIMARVENADPHLSEDLIDMVRGNPGALESIMSLFSDTNTTPREILLRLKDFERPGILGPDGKPLSPGSVHNSLIVSDVISTNERLLARVQNDPEEIYRLESREFEELVAELLQLQGYSVELTPPSKDGGFDMYAARKDGLGEFLFLVECKRWASGKRVGVEIVRGLYGVVQQQQATAGIVVTTSLFTKGAKEFQHSLRHSLSLRDYIQLQEWLDLVKPKKAGKDRPPLLLH